MKALLITLGVLGVGTAAFFIIRSQVPPNFSIESLTYDDATKKVNPKGRFLFGGLENTFSLDKFGSVPARNKWGVVYGSKDKKTISFDLYKNNVFVKNLKTV